MADLVLQRQVCLKARGSSGRSLHRSDLQTVVVATFAIHGYRLSIQTNHLMRCHLMVILLANVDSTTGYYSIWRSYLTGMEDAWIDTSEQALLWVVFPLAFISLYSSGLLLLCLAGGFFHDVDSYNNKTTTSAMLQRMSLILHRHERAKRFSWSLFKAFFVLCWLTGEQQKPILSSSLLTPLRSSMYQLHDYTESIASVHGMAIALRVVSLMLFRSNPAVPLSGVSLRCSFD